MGGNYQRLSPGFVTFLQSSNDRKLGEGKVFRLEHLVQNLRLFQWLTGVLQRAPSEILSLCSESITRLKKAKSQLVAMLPKAKAENSRSLLIHLGDVASAAYLLDHAIWAFENREREWRIDVACFARWMEDASSLDDLLRGDADLQGISQQMLYGKL